jgi:predicted Zn-dependent peptidase
VTAAKPRARLAAASLLAALLLSSCASRPAPTPAKAAAVEARAAAALPAASAAETASAAAQAAAALGSRPSGSREGLAYMNASLADYLRERLPNGATLAVKRQAGRKTAAARIALARDGREAPASEAGYEALALATAARAAVGSEAGSVERAAFEAGASMELRLDDYDDVALEVLGPPEGMAAVLGRIARALAAPAFLPEDFDRALREARVAERRESGDPLVRAGSELRAELYRDHPYGLPPGGTASSLAAATREGVMRYWSARFAPERLVVVVVGDFEGAAFARELELEFGALPSGSAGAAAGGGPAAATQARSSPGLPVRPWFKALPLSGMPGSALLRGEFAAPAASSPDYPAMTVALAMLDDLLLEALRGGKGLAYGAWTRLSSASAPSVSLTVYKTGDPAAAKAAVDGAIADIARGLCIDSSSAEGGLGKVELSLEAYKARSITAVYAKGASSEGMAARIARDLASGGDGTAMFRMASRIASVRAEDVVRVARQRLLEGPSAWIALGDPALVDGLSPEAFARSDRP